MKYFFYTIMLVTVLIMGCAKATEPIKVEQKSYLSVEFVYPTVGVPQDMIVTDDYIFLAEDQAGFSIYDIENKSLLNRQKTKPEDPFSDNVEYFSNIRQLSYIPEKDLLLVFDRYSPTSIYVYDVSDINDLDYLGNNIGGDLGSIQFLQSYYDEAQDKLMVAIATTNSRFRYGTIEPEWNYVFDTIDYPLPNAIRNFQIVDDYVYFAGAQRGLYLYDKSSMSLVSETNITGEALDVKVKGDYAYVVCKQEGLRVVDISDKDNPVWIEDYYYNTTGFAQSIDIEGDYLVVGSGGGGIYLFDIGTTPEKPVFLERMTTSVVDYVYFVAIRNGKIFVAGQYKGITQLRINN